MKGRISSVHCLHDGFGDTAGAGSASRYTSELAVQVAMKLFSDSNTKPTEIDYLILCTQTPDYLLPTTACLVQSQIGLRSSVGAIDLAGGVLSFVFALALAQGLISSDQARTVMIITADINAPSGSAAALLVVADPGRESADAFAFGSEIDAAVSLDTVLAASGLDWLAHQVVPIAHPGGHQPDQTSSTLPIALSDAVGEKRVSRGDKLVLVGNDLAGSWAGAMVTW
ncbi:hypothetical protein E3T28_14560 [Cryobacterium sinapicolor]|uniref:Beta-ketoacyl-[acyl-carrier-protein] synthase III N-terminal domain-containing protein n=1 Tax=Cryobacterium sinapicolor TaxID=1259236 RepID=A0ABY2ITS9_9MICO|nr:hypothetical protein [Cryobacterium sinapicolor]TFC94712.1 hypothetical protein E3T28_14560 [Cryobacterium sinapicolor]